MSWGGGGGGGGGSMVQYDTSGTSNNGLSERNNLSTEPLFGFIFL